MYLACLVRIAIAVNGKQDAFLWSIVAYLEIAEESLCAFICRLHSPINRHGPQCGTEPAYMLGRTPEHTRTLRRDGQSNTEVFQVELVVSFADNVFIGIVSRESADGCA